MRIVMHDYSGHPFQVQLSRELAQRGHHVLHLYFESFQTPKGGVMGRADDPPHFNVQGLRCEGEFSKYNHFVRRRRQEIQYGKMVARRITQYRPDVVLSSNTPIDAQRVIQREVRGRGIPFVFWLQDIYSAGINTFLRKKRLPFAGLIGAWYQRLESAMLRASDAVVAISPDFLPVLERWRVEPRRLHTIENWAPWAELTPRPQDNPWSRSHGLAGKFVFLYSGTIGLKHDPRLLLDLAESMRHDPDSAVVVVSEGINADLIREQARLRGLSNLHSLPLQPYELMPEVLSSGSVLVALLDEDAGGFSVPSKVLSYLCVRRPLLLSIPARNAAARIVHENSAGLVVPAGDSQALIAGARRLHEDAGLRRRCASNGFVYARKEFDIERIGDRFEAIVNSLHPAKLPLLAGNLEAVR